MTDSRTRRPVTQTLTILSLVLIAAVVVALLIGEVAITPNDAWHSVLSRLGIGEPPVFDAVFWSIRVPRVAAGVVVGAALGTSGALLQGVHRNDMADPYLVGISSAAGLGTAIAISLTPTTVPTIVIIGLAAATGAGFSVLTRRISRSTLDPTRFILVGVMLGISLFAWTVILVFMLDSPRLPTFTYFVFGSLGAATTKAVWSAALLIAVGLGIAGVYARELDVLAIGERDAHHLGLNVRRVTTLVLVGAGIATGASVGLAGVIGFVGLLAPYVVRRWIGPGHRPLLVASALAGAIFVVAADVGARLIAGPVEVPIGIVTAAVGGPLLAWLLYSRASDSI